METINWKVGDKVQYPDRRGMTVGKIVSISGEFCVVQPLRGGRPDHVMVSGLEKAPERK